MSSAHRPPRLALWHVSKRYPGVVANDDISFEVLPGEIHAVLGENGAGKSTLMKIIYGVVQADAGQLLWNGREVRIASPAAARALGIGMVFQHFSLFESLSVAENIALALDARIELSALARRVTELSQRYGLPVDPRRLVAHLSVGERQRVEILRCLVQNPQLLILDEPTSVLTPQAVDKLFATLRRLAAEGVSILYISHKLHEIRALCDRATVLRAGRVSGSALPREESAESLARMMIGRALPVCTAAPYTGDRRVLLQVRNLSRPAADAFGTALHAISLEVAAGEIVGIAGVSGNGQAELLAALSGERPGGRGCEAEVLLDGRPVGRLSAGRRRDLGLAFVPEERLGRGAVPAMSLAANALLTGHRHGLARRGMRRPAAMAEFARRVIARFDVRGGAPDTAAGALSGGNLQKFIVGREILQAPKLMLVAQPTWGVDVGAAAFLRQTLLDLARSGVAIVVVSEELDELFELCDRIAVLAGGRLSPAVARAETDAERVGLLMAGSESAHAPT